MAYRCSFRVGSSARLKERCEFGFVLQDNLLRFRALIECIQSKVLNKVKDHCLPTGKVRVRCCASTLYLDGQGNAVVMTRCCSSCEHALLGAKP